MPALLPYDTGGTNGQFIYAGAGTPGGIGSGADYGMSLPAGSGPTLIPGANQQNKQNLLGTNIPVYGANGLIIGYRDATTGLMQTTPDPNSQFTVLDKAKNPAIATATANQVTQAAATNAGTNASLTDALAQAKAAQGVQTAAIANDAQNIDQTGYSSQLAAIIGQYAKQAGDINTQYQQANDSLAAKQNQVVTNLGNIDTQYATDANAVAANALKYATAANSRFQLGSGTPMSNSGDLTNRAIQAYANINLPVAAQIAQMQQQQQTGFVAPLNQTLYGNQVNQLGYQTGVNQNLASMGTTAAGAVAQLKAAVAGKTFAEAQAYMAQLGVPIQLQQQVMQGNTQNLSAISALDQGNNFYGLAAPYNASFATLPSFTGTPSYSGGGSSSGFGGGYRGGGAAGAAGGAQPNVTYGNPNTTTVAAPGAVPGAYPVNNQIPGGNPIDDAINQALFGGFQGGGYANPAYYQPSTTIANGWTPQLNGYPGNTFPAGTPQADPNLNGAYSQYINSDNPDAG